jgi:hypothetical protein
MSFGLGPNIYLRGAIPLYSNMVASATDLLSGGLFPFELYLHFIAFSMGMCSCLALFEFYLHFCKHEH